MTASNTVEEDFVQGQWYPNHERENNRKIADMIMAHVQPLENIIFCVCSSMEFDATISYSAFGGQKNRSYRCVGRACYQYYTVDQVKATYPHYFTVIKACIEECAAGRLKLNSNFGNDTLSDVDSSTGSSDVGTDPSALAIQTIIDHKNPAIAKALSIIAEEVEKASAQVEEHKKQANRITELKEENAALKQQINDSKEKINKVAAATFKEINSLCGE